jgi:quercetin dioxygenase-like cupin family protein
MEPFTALLACELEAGGSVGEHVQTEYPETVIVLEGRGQATISGRVVTLSPGAAVFLPLGQTLAIDNASASEPLRYLIIKAKSL